MLQCDLQLFEPNLYKIQIIGNHLYLLDTCVHVWGGGSLPVTLGLSSSPSCWIVSAKNFPLNPVLILIDALYQVLKTSNFT